ncbi:MAG: peptide chain release factor 2 [Bacilli bacterium]
MYGGHFDIDNKIKRENQINKLMLNPSFWDNREEADKLIRELKEIKDITSKTIELNNRIKDNCDVLNEPNLDADLLFLAGEEVADLKVQIDKLSLQTYLSGEYDNNNAIIEIHAGAGGTESCDWVNMLYRMYSRFALNNNYSLIELDRQDGEEVGIKSVMFQINGPFAYGYLKGERGVHRLVRISPFDANKRRHTSFAAVDVMPEVDKTINVEIPDSDIRIDIYRSSGPGGQGVNTTDSAVRITHIPTGIVVTCQNERSQIRNKEKALEVLKGKLYLLEEEKQNEKLSGIRGKQLTNGFGSAKRSYILCPYTLVKDNDSGYETSNVDAILNGEINEILEVGLKVE